VNYDGMRSRALTDLALADRSSLLGLPDVTISDTRGSYRPAAITSEMLFRVQLPVTVQDALSKRRS
jgi:hypothetical protein